MSSTAAPAREDWTRPLPDPSWDPKRFPPSLLPNPAGAREQANLLSVTRIPEHGGRVAFTPR